MDPDYYIGLDLGQTTDFTALAVLERSLPENGSRRPDEPLYALRYLQCYHLGTAYTEVVRRVRDLARAAPINGQGTLVVDQTGVGRPVVDMLERASVPAEIVAVTITSGHSVSVGPDGSRHVPKKDLVTTLQVVLQSSYGRVLAQRKLQGDRLPRRRDAMSLSHWGGGKDDCSFGIAARHCFPFGKDGARFPRILHEAACFCLEIVHIPCTFGGHHPRGGE